MQAAVEQIKEKPTVSIPSGQKARVFSVTNAAGGVYDGYFELLAPGDARTNVPTFTQERSDFGKEKNDEIARLKLNYAEKQLREAEAKAKVGMIDPLTLEKARADRDILSAELKGDAVEMARIKLEIAEKELKVAERKFENGVVSSDEVAKAKLARDIAAISLRQAEAGNLK